ncbi:molybdopterin synthase [Natronomonas halophila]|uniref:molybdopterin synthase n=1 Tax=Natronomonas halophila TaxID=2747817 RepID=UPI0015B66AFE|nr:molybdopterin synthase [Natronomonas halophila]QLD86715.1 molybdopterin synthase [Natronomonas halophila]
MYAFAVSGADAEAALRRLAPALDGRLGVVRIGEAAADGGVAATRTDTEYTLDDGWRASGDDLSPGDALDRLAPDHDYAAVLGAVEARVPTLVVDGEGDIEDPLVETSDADSLDIEATVDAIHETDPYETLESLVASVKRSPEAEYSGGIATFTGRVRPKDDEDDPRTTALEFEKYEGVAEERMRTIETELEDRDGVLDVRLHHRTGRIEAGEDIVFVVVLAGHREEAFRTVEDGINRLKDEVPLFKKEVTEEETFWVHQRD